MRRALAAALFAVTACAHAPPAPPGPAAPATSPQVEAPSPAAPAPEAAPAPSPATPPAPREQVGFASYYGRRFQGRRTASGERYDVRKLTCARRTAPFGARLRITELEGGRSVVVRVNDRGPFARGRVVDLSLAAARALGIVRRGVVRVRIEPLDGE